MDVVIKVPLDMEVTEVNEILYIDTGLFLNHILRINRPAFFLHFRYIHSMVLSSLLLMLVDGLVFCSELGIDNGFVKS